MSTFTKDHLATPVSAPAELAAFLAAGGRPRERWGVGVEFEKLVIDRRTGEAADYPRIVRLLEGLAAAGHWQEVREDGALIALKGGNSSVTLEPGGQLELSGKLCRNLFCSHGDLAGHLRRATALAADLDLLLLGLGSQPFTPLEKIGRVPKPRYAVMAPYMERVGDMGLRMMHQTAGVQVNLDFADEAGCFARLRLSQALAPLLYALFANSPLLDGAPSGFLSSRGEIWRRTDPDRCGLLPFLFDENAGFAAYVEHALDVPMYFIHRRDRYLDMTGERFTFRRYLAEGFAGERATMADWDLHLSTLFTEVRLRPQIEVRSMDSLPIELCLAPAALLKGLLYDEQALSTAWALCRPASLAELDASLQSSWRAGLKSPWRGGTLRDLARDCLALAREGLARQRRGDDCDEGRFLDAAEQLLAGGQTLAEQLLDCWHGEPAVRLEQLAARWAFPTEIEDLCPHSCADAPDPDCGQNFYP